MCVLYTGTHVCLPRRFVYYSSVGLVNASLLGYQSGDLGALPLGSSHKSWGTRLVYILFFGEILETWRRLEGEGWGSVLWFLWSRENHGQPQQES